VAAKGGRSKETTSITYYVGVLNILLAVIWLALYSLGVLRESSINAPTATPFYVGTLFAVGFGIIFPFFEKTMSGKSRINTGLTYSFLALMVYAGMVATYLLRSSLMFYDVTELWS
jgi:hypothetical protein